MANLWTYQDEAWSFTELREAVLLQGGSVAPAALVGPDMHKRSILLYPASRTAGLDHWVLVASPETRVRVNDARMLSGMRVLADRDALRVPGQPVIFFTTESLARIQPFAGDADTYCPRCKLEIEAGTPAVCCGGCGVWHHQDAEQGRNCWQYTQKCALCDQDTTLDSPRFRWMPENLWS